MMKNTVFLEAITNKAAMNIQVQCLYGHTLLVFEIHITIFDVSL